MSTTSKPAAATEIMEQVPLQPHQPPEDRAGRRVLWATLGSAAALITALIIGGVYLLDRDADDTVESSAVEADAPAVASDPAEQTSDAAATDDQTAASTSPTTAPATTANPTTRPTTDEPTAAPQLSGPFQDPATLLLAFGSAWDSADWDRMRTMADEDVVSVATEWYEAGGTAGITSETIDAILEGCGTPADGATTCQLLYLPTEGYGLIFQATYTTVGDTVTLTELTFAGDAG